MVSEWLPRRAEVLRAVIDVADERLDGHLPMGVDGVCDTFGDEITLLGALQLRWHTRLAARIEHELVQHPLDRENAVVLAWLDTAEDMPGIRKILDHHADLPTSVRMAEAITRATTKEREMLALLSDRAEAPGEEAAGLGRTIEWAARASYVPHEPGLPASAASPAPTLLQRLRAAWVA